MRLTKHTQQKFAMKERDNLEIYFLNNCIVQHLAIYGKKKVSLDSSGLLDTINKYIKIWWHAKTSICFVYYFPFLQCFCPVLSGKCIEQKRNVKSKSKLKFKAIYSRKQFRNLSQKFVFAVM